MLEVKSNQLNEHTGHWRMTVYSTNTKCTMSLIESEDGITTYRHCPKRVTDKQIIEKLEQIAYTHKRIANCNTYDSLTLKIDDLIGLINDRPHYDKHEQIGFPVGIPKLADLE